MSDEDFQKRVLDALGTLAPRFDTVDARMDSMGTRLDGMEMRLDAIVTRLDEQDHAMDGLTSKVDRLQQNVASALGAAEEAITGLVAASRRLNRLENPGT